MQQPYIQYQDKEYSTPDATRNYIKSEGGIVHKDKNGGGEHVGTVGNHAITGTFGQDTLHWRKLDINASADNQKLFNLLKENNMVSVKSVKDGKIDLWTRDAVNVVLEKHLIEVPNGIQVIRDVSNLDLTFVEKASKGGLFDVHNLPQKKQTKFKKGDIIKSMPPEEQVVVRKYFKLTQQHRGK